uniref:Uncharacterized protein n=1 Tax=Candidozyma auris TaxID=498019 RepID=A0A0L0P3K6_CANAR
MAFDGQQQVDEGNFDVMSSRRLNKNGRAIVAVVKLHTSRDVYIYLQNIFLALTSSLSVEVNIAQGVAPLLSGFGVVLTSIQGYLNINMNDN